MNAPRSSPPPASNRKLRRSLLTVPAVVCIVFWAGNGYGREHAATNDVPPAHPASATGYVHGAPRFTLEDGRTVEYLGTFSADARFKKAPLLHCLSSSAPPLRTMPVSMLRSSERPLLSIAPPAHASAMPQVQSLNAGAMTGIATLVYGHAPVMVAPQTVVTDSMQRVIVADPAMPGVHVLDPAGKSSFRILGGPGARIQSVGHVDVDADDNIYVADPVRGVVLVFDPNGRFLRELGTFHGESLYELITSIAIDRKSGRLYLTDGPRHLLVILDLEGNVIKRVGEGRIEGRPGELARRDPPGPKEFDYPTDITVGAGKIAVLDSGGTRVRLLDPDGKLVGSFSVQHAAEDKAAAIQLDDSGDVYVSYPGLSQIRIYSAHGERLAAFGSAGYKVGQFLCPDGLWIDAARRLYVADMAAARVQVFQISGAP